MDTLVSMSALVPVICCASKLPILEVVKEHPKNVILAMGARFAENACFYIFSVFVLSYAADRLGMARSTRRVCIVT